jgi:MFS family permease
MSLLIILGVRNYLGEEAFRAWGWRIPFLLSVVLLGISVWIRLQLNESPTFKRMKAEGKGSNSPLLDSFGNKKNLKLVLLALLGLTAGQAVVWYTGQFYSLFYLTQTLKIEANTANIMIAIALLVATPFFVIFGSLSDRIGRKPIIMAGCLIAALTYFPIFKAITHFANPALAAAQASAPVRVFADPASCSFQFNPVGTTAFTSSCDIIKSFMARNAVNYENVAAPAGAIATVQIGNESFTSFEGGGLTKPEFDSRRAGLDQQLTTSIRSHGYPASADPTRINYVMTTVMLFILVLYVTMVYGPIAAMLVEMFPTRIRYTSMSLPYHIGNGWFGGFLLPVAFAVVAATGNIYDGLWYPIIIATMTLVIGLLFINETKNNDINA